MTVNSSAFFCGGVTISCAPNELNMNEQINAIKPALIVCILYDFILMVGGFKLLTQKLVLQ